MRILRIALCQFETHPALYLGNHAFLEEPFVPIGKPSLAQLGTKGIDVSPLQQMCLEKYIAWHELRVLSTLRHIETINPIPDIVLFPEGAIPLQLLPGISQWSSTTGSTILAGTHTPQQNPSSQECYRSLGLDRKDLRQLFKYQSLNVLPLIVAGRTRIIPKRLPSPFEMPTTLKSTPAAPSLRPFSSIAQGRSFDFLPVICSEALQLPNIRKTYDLVALIAYDQKPAQFQSFIETQVRNKRPVAFCNDGAFGGSLVAVAMDNRMPNWLNDALPDGLPPGDAILVVDIDLDVTAVEVGTAVPGVSHRLVSLASIIGGHDEVHAVAAKQISEIALFNQSSVRANSLKDLLRQSGLNRLQRVRLDYLLKQEERGLPTQELWEELGRDCIIPGLTSLRDLEGQMSAACARSLTPMLGSQVAQKPDVAGLFMKFLAECNSKAGNRTADALPNYEAAYNIAILNRDTEISSIHSFLDQPTLLVLEVTGLRGIGKSSTLKKAISQSGITAVLNIEISETSSADYLLYSILQRGGGQPKPPYDNPMDVARGPSIRAAFKTVRVLVLEHAHLLLDKEAWRDERLAALLDSLFESAEAERTKIIIESRRELPLPLRHPALRSRLHIKGLNKEARRFGIALFDAQLRRVNLLPSVVGEREKELIVEKLGGHPVAIALAAEVSYDEGVDSLILALKERRGFFLQFLEDLVRGLRLTDEQLMVMRLLCLARSGIPRSVVLESVSFAAGPAVRALVALSAVEVTQGGWIEIASVLREYFDPAELTTDVIAAFHTSAAHTLARLAKDAEATINMAVEAEYHAGLAGVDVGISTGLVDGAIATAQAFYERQKYDEASAILKPLIESRRSLDILRLGAQVEARRNNFDSALSLAREVFKRNPRDTALLAELAKITLTQFQENITEQLIAIARDAAVEDVSILITEGRMYLRRGNFERAEAVFRRATEITEKNPWPFFYLGRTLLRAGQLDEAIDVLHEGEEFYYEVEARGRASLDAIRTQLGLAYLLTDRLDLAATILESLLQQENPNPEAIRAFAALAIKRDGIKEAHQVLQRLQAAGIRNRNEEAQFRLLYGLFYLGIGDLSKASTEFSKAHAADRTHVFVMMKWARTLFDLAIARFSESDETYKVYVTDCARLVRKILEFDSDNREGISLMQGLRNRFSVEI